MRTSRGPGPAHANAVTDWNAITITAVGTGRPGPVGLLDIALVQAAVHDAVQAIDGRFEPYKVEVPGADGSREAAAAAAAYYVLVGIYPTQAGTLNPTYDDYLAAHGLVGDPGLAVGQQVAAAFLPLRRNPPTPLPGDNSSTDPGRWRPTDSFLQDRAGQRVAWAAVRAAPTLCGWGIPVDGHRSAVHLQEPRKVPRRAPARFVE